MNQEVSLDILYRDDAIVVVDKPGGLLAVPGRGPDKQDCVVSRLRAICPDCIPQPAVHRLDMATSGLMVLGLTAGAHRGLSVAFESRSITKQYVAVLEGRVQADAGEIQLPFRLDPDNRPHQVYDPVNGKTGITRWRKIDCSSGRTRVAFIPLTGRTHQLRLHASHPGGLGCPIVGDSLYGSGRQGDPMLLHASGLQFSHPVTGQILCFISPAPF
jgi:tRNA pseudouridine32 synthase/23S rRNA pseudouridine746 synthase